MKAHLHKVDLTDVKELWEVRIFENDEDVEGCMELETEYQGCKLVRIKNDNTAWVSLLHGIWSGQIFRQVRDFLQDECNVDLIEWSGNGRIRKLTRRKR